MRMRLGFLASIAVSTALWGAAVQARAAKPAELKAEQVRPIAEAYTALVFKTYDDLLRANEKLKAAAENLVKNPVPESLEAAKAAWKEARLVYSRTESFRFYGGPIDKADGAAEERGPEPLMNAWPIDESYLDYVKGNETAGLVQNATQPLSEAVLIEANEKNGERNISTGYHAIEFLLWGQDLSITGPGQRPVSDYQPSVSKAAARRGQVLVILASLLVKQSEGLKAAWDPDAKQTARFRAEKPDEILRKILVGVTTLSADEMAGERLTVALEKKDPEHEQDCFSDFSLEDLKANQRGIMDVLTQTGLMAFFAKTKKAETAALQKQLAQTLKTLESIPAPLDAILVSAKSPHRKKIEAAIAALQKQAVLVDRITKTWGLELNVQSE